MHNVDVEDAATATFKLERFIRGNVFTHQHFLPLLARIGTALGETLSTGRVSGEPSLSVTKHP